MQPAFNVGQLVRPKEHSPLREDGRAYCIVRVLSSQPEDAPIYCIKNIVGNERTVGQNDIEPAPPATLP